MAANTVIEIDQVSKGFTLHPERAQSFQSLFVGALQRKRRRQSLRLWALRDISFQVSRGEAVALIGLNGSGKSTCLKLLARIIEPSDGTLSVKGRVSALLEVGAGFHPELTGRENIYLYGAVLGVPRQELALRFKEIVAFAELERFIDVPVKSYSSGMYVRLGFATAVSVQPDILLIDEVLAVGDQSFQAKCLQRIHEMQLGGVTIVFVSHDLEAVRHLCQRALWFDLGRLRSDGPVEATIADYTASLQERGLVPASEPSQDAITPEEVALEQSLPLQEPEEPGPEISQVATTAEAPPEQQAPLQEPEEAPSLVPRRRGSLSGRIVDVALTDKLGRQSWTLETREPCVLELSYQVDELIHEPVFGFAIHTSDGTHVSGTNTHLCGADPSPLSEQGMVCFEIPDLVLTPGDYLLSVAFHSVDEKQAYDYQDFAYPFTVIGSRDQARAEGLVFVGGSWAHRPALQESSGRSADTGAA